MATQSGSSAPLEVGSILKETRRRQGIELETVEQETKIRGKYLRALEDEEWEVLPGPAYTRGFIRAYAELLGLDSEVLVDEYRRRYEETATSSYGLEPLLHGRGTREGMRPPGRRRLVIAAILAVVVLGLLVLGLTAGDDEGPRERPRKAERDKQQGKRPAGGGGGGGGQRKRELPDEITVKLVAASDVQACLVDADGEVLVPDQLLTAGVEDGPYVSKRFRVELDPGEARVFVNGKPETRASPEAVAYRVTPAGVEEASFSGGLCP